MPFPAAIFRAARSRSLLPIAVLVGCLTGALTAPFANAAQDDLQGPTGSERFGDTVTALPNGNVVITDPLYDEGGIDIGAVYVIDSTLGLVSFLKGSTNGDQIGSNGIVVLANGNFLVRSPRWDNGAAGNAGAVTWCSMTTGCNGEVSAANSLVGGTSGDDVGGAFSTAALTNGNYVVGSPSWDNGGTANVGAATWCNGTTGCIGLVSTANALVGSTAGDNVGGPIALTNGNYVVVSANWNNGVATGVGAVTWCNGTTNDCAGHVVSPANSLVGGTTNDHVGGFPGVTPLVNGNYVVRSINWDGVAVDVGAVTWGNGNGGTVGTVAAGNSLVGGTVGDQVGSGSVTPLTNGNYVVLSPSWDNPVGPVANVGAVTWGNGTTGTAGLVGAGNSLVGDAVASPLCTAGGGVTALANGNYVVTSPEWDDPAIGGNNDVGAAMWCSGTAPTTGPVTAANSLVGAHADDLVGAGAVAALSGGNYVVVSPFWDDTAGGHVNAGAATYGNGTTGTTGPVTAAGSLIGSDTGSVESAVALTNGNYVVVSTFDSGGATNVGAVTWCDGAGTIGVVSAANSIIGSTTDDRVGNGGVTPLPNGNFVVTSINWGDGASTSLGAVTLGDGNGGTTAAVSAANSLVGTLAGDQVGFGAVRAFSNGTYVVQSSRWKSVAGAVTICNAVTPTVGQIVAANSVIGSAFGITGFAYEPTHDVLAVAQISANTVSFLVGAATGPQPTPTAAPTPSPTPTVDLKGGRKCRAAIATAASTLVQAEAKAEGACEASVVAGKLPAGTDCRTEAKAGAAFAKARAKLAGAVMKACGGKNKECGSGGDDIVLADTGFSGACPGVAGGGCTDSITDCDGIAACITCIGESGVTRSLGLYYDALVPTSPKDKAQKALNKCQATIGRAATAFLVAKEKVLTKCWTAVNAGKAAGACPAADGKAVGAIAKAEAKKVTAICKACGGADKTCNGSGDFTPAEIGFAAGCPSVTPPGGASCSATVATLQDLVTCADCVTGANVDCVVLGAVPAFAAYPPECGP